MAKRPYKNPQERKEKISVGLKLAYASGKRDRRFTGVRGGFKKGVIPWNKDKKGVMPVAWNKGKVGYMAGSENHNWKGGVSKIDKAIRQMYQYSEWRSKVFERDGWECQTCHDRGYVTAHHIKSFSAIIKENKITTTVMASKCLELWDIENGVTLCENCHSLTDNYKKRI